MCSLSAGQDYNPLTQILEFQSGETQTNITITIHDDTKIEGDEQFELYLIGGIGVHLSPFPRAMITIQNDDGKNLFYNFIKSVRECTTASATNSEWDSVQYTCMHCRKFAIKAGQL